MIQCEFSEKGKILLDKLAKKDMKITESSEHLQCRYDARNDILTPFMNKMTRLQRHYHKVTLDVLKERIQLWKDFENNKITLNTARDNNLQLENKIDILCRKSLNSLSPQKNDNGTICICLYYNLTCYVSNFSIYSYFTDKRFR